MLSGSITRILTLLFLYIKILDIERYTRYLDIKINYKQRMENILMLKTHRNGETWLVSQPDHGAVAGFLAAHWGNDEFAVQGGMSRHGNSERLHAETVLAIAEHDNGWWEWEATPDRSDVDGLPLDLKDALKNQQDGMDRWRLGIPRFSEHHPYVSLLISYHAHLLYSAATDPGLEPERLHPLFWKGRPGGLMAGPREHALAFMAEVEGQQAELLARLRSDPATKTWVEPETLKPAARLLQVLDGMSLALSSPLVPAVSGVSVGLGEDSIDFLDVPRRSWQDRVTIQVRPIGERRLVLDPYPFGESPLHVNVPVRIVKDEQPPTSPFEVWWRTQQPELVQFELLAP